MPTTPSILGNTFSQTCLTIQCTYDGLANGYVGPTGTNSTAFCIQSPNKQPALYITNIATTYKNSNTLCFNSLNTDTVLCLYSGHAFCINDNCCTYFRVGPNNCLLFGTGSNTSTFSINSNGVGIGTSTPVNKLDVRGCSSSYVASTLWNEYSATAANPHTHSIFQMGVKSGSNLAYISQYVHWASGSPYYHISNQCVCSFYSNFNNYFFRDYNDRTLFYLSSEGYSELRANQYNIHSGDWAGLGLRNMQPYGSHWIDFLNSSGGRHSSMHSTQYQDGGSELRFMTTAPGAYNETDRRSLVVTLAADKKANFYGNLCSLTGCFNFISGSEACINGNIKADYVSTNGLINKGARTTFGADGAGYHWFAAFPYTSELSLGYGFGRSLSSNSQTGYVTEHSWYSSGLSLMRLTPSFLQVSGVICSNSGLKITGSSANNIYGKSLCIALTDANYNYSISGNQCLIGCLLATSFGSFNSINLTGTSATLTSCICHCLCVANNSYLKGVSAGAITATSISSTSCLLSPVLYFGSVRQCESAESNNFCTDLIVGTSCNKQVKSINTAKAWGIFNLKGGVASYVSGYNFCSVFNTSTYVPIGPTGIISDFLTPFSAYSIRFCNPIKGPFSASFSVFDQFISGNFVGGATCCPVFTTSYRLSNVVLQNCISTANTAFANTAASYVPYMNTTTFAQTSQLIYEILVSPILADTCSYSAYTAANSSYFSGIVAFQVFSY